MFLYSSTAYLILVLFPEENAGLHVLMFIACKLYL